MIKKNRLPVDVSSRRFLNNKEFTNVKFLSLWQNQSQKKHINYPIIEGKFKTDIVVIGGGITGLGAAYELGKKKKNFILIEKDRIGSGSSGNNAGLLGSDDPLTLTKLSKVVGRSKATEHYRKNRIAFKKIKKIIQQEKIACDFEKCGMIGCFKKTGSKDNGLQLESKLLKKLGFHTKLNEDKCKIQIHRRYKKFLHLKEYASIHSYKLLSALAKIHQKHIFEKSPAIKIKKEKNGKYRIQTPKGSIETKKIIFANNYHMLKELRSNTDIFNNKKSLKKNKIFITYCLATRPLTKRELKMYGSKPYSAFYTDEKFYFYGKISKDHRLIFGGLDDYVKQPHAISKKEKTQKLKKLYEKLVQLFPKIKLKPEAIDYFWSGYDVETHNTLPMQEELFKDIYFSGFYDGVGMAKGFYNGMKIAKKVCRNFS